MVSHRVLNNPDELVSSFLGLAPFLRMNLSGDDMLPLGQQMKVMVERQPDNAILWMNLSTVMFCLGEREIGLALQAQALRMNRVYRLYTAGRSVKLRLLLLMAPGDLSANTPLDCLLENSDIELIYYYVDVGSPFVSPLPDHDLLMVAIGESDENLELLAFVENTLSHWPKPVINTARHIPAIGRQPASVLLQNIPGLLMPVTYRISREALSVITTGDAVRIEGYADCAFPVIVRPVGSHGGHDLEKIESANEIGVYLSGPDMEAETFYLSGFIDYKGRDGLFRKFRVALLDGTAFICHMAVSENWMIHYVNAGMYDDAGKRSEEAEFMANFDRFLYRHAAALHAIQQRIGLEYLCVDCAETRDGRLLVFEIDHAMVVHDMDSEELFPYKRQHIRKLQTAFRDFLFRKAAAGQAT